MSVIFSWWIHIWNFKTLACTVQKLGYASNAQNDKGPWLKKYFSEFIQTLIRSSTHCYQSIPQIFNALASIIVSELFCWQDFIHIFSNVITQKRGIILIRKKIYVSYFLWGTQIWNFKELACTVQKLGYASKSVQRKNAQNDKRP